MPLPRGLFPLLREAARHLLRRPVVGVAAVATTEDGRVLLVRRGDTGEWALPGGTLEWGEALRTGITRELLEEGGVRVIELGTLVGVYSRPDRDLRFHAVTVVVRATIAEPHQPPGNPAEITGVGLFAPVDLPGSLAMGMSDMLADARAGRLHWE